MADQQTDRDDQQAPVASISSGHIRTFARDVAKVTGKPLPKNVVNVSAPPPIPPPIQNVVAPLPIPPPVVPASAVQAPVTPIAPVITIPPAEPDSLIQNTDASRAEILARMRAKLGTGPITVAPEPIPVDTAQIAKREEILARLRKNGITVAPLATAPPAPVTPAYSPRTPSEPPPGIPQVSKEPLRAAPLHTYKSDFADRTRTTNATPLSMLAAEQDALSSRVPEAVARKKVPWLALSAGIILILAGTGGVYAAYRYVAEQQEVPIVPFIPSLIFADERVRIVGTGEELQRALTDLTKSELREGGVVIAYVTVSTTTPEGVTTEEPTSGGALVEAMGLKAPDILLRNIGAASTVGAVRAGNETYPFLILRVGSYERTFAGMLAWEKTVLRDLRLLYPAYPAPVAPPTPATASTTASTTVPVPPTSFIPVWKDETVTNHDVRVAHDREGRTLFVYGYRDKDTLIIARNEAAFEELLSRLAATRAQ